MSKWLEATLADADAKTKEVRDQIASCWNDHGETIEEFAEFFSAIPTLGQAYRGRRMIYIARWTIDAEKEPDRASAVIAMLTELPGAGYDYKPTNTWAPLSVYADGVEVNLRGVNALRLPALASMILPLENIMIEREKRVALAAPSEEVGL